MIEKISVLIITRNREKMLENSLNSLIAQTRMPDEVIVVDNASTDDTKEVINKFTQKLNIVSLYQPKISIS